MIGTDGKTITLWGATDKGGNAASILDSQQSHRVLQCVNGESECAALENLVIRNGFSANMGGGITEDRHALESRALQGVSIIFFWSFRR